MAAAMTMDREPEVARFIDSYKYDQDMATRRDRYGGGTSLPLNSDGYEEKQQRLRDERHKDWLVQQDKAIDHPPSIAKHPFTGPVAAGPQSSADYDEEIQRMTDRYHNRYNEQRQMEQQKYEARRRSPPRPAQPPGPQMDYNLAGEQARAEERRAYQDYMGKYQSSYIPTKVPLDYEENKKILNEERRREYNEMMEQKAKEERYWAMRGRPVTPPGGLDIGKYDRQLKETAQQKKKEYKEMLDQQQREHMYLRARQEPEMAVIDRNAAQTSQYLANKPPPGPSYGKGRDEAFKTESQSQPIPERPRHGQPPYTGAGASQRGTGGGRYSSDTPKRAMVPVASPPKSPLKPVDRELLKVPVRDDERPSELGTPLAFKTESQNALYGQQGYQEPGQSQNEAGRDSLNQQAKERAMPPVTFPPRSPEKPANPEWLKIPLRDDERPSELGTPLAFKTDTYSRQPPPAPEQAYSHQPPNVLEQSYPKQQPSKSVQPYTGPSFSRDGPRPVEKYEKYTNDVEGLFGRPEQSPDRPRSRRSYDAERRPSPSKKDGAVLPNNQLSPRRMKNVLYTDSEEVSSKRREASKERQKEYNEFLKLKAEERRRQDEMRQQQQMSKPAELVKNPYYSSDDYEKFQREIQRKQGEEYRDFLAKKSTEVHNRGWNFEQNGVLELRGDDEVQTRQRELRAERQKDYNSYISQMKTPSKRTWPDPEGRGALLVKQGEYDNVRQMYDEERKRDYIDRMQKRREMGLDLTPPSAPPEPLKGRYEYNNPMVDVLGRYDDYRKKLVDDRKRDFRTFMDQVKADEGSRRHLVSTAPNLAREETPLVYSMGTYELETKKQMRLERKKDLEDFVHEQQKHWTPRTTVKENLMPHVASAETPLVNYLGHYDKEKLKYRLERNKDLREFSQQKKQQQRNPYDNYVFPTVAVAEKPIVDYMGTGLAQRKRQLRDERKRDYEEYKMQVASNNQKYTNPSRRHDFVDTASGPYGGLFHGLGEHGNKSDVLNKERQQEYNDRLDHQFGKDRPSGRPNWVKETLPNNTDRGRSPMKSQPPADQYQQMLDEKRREEASRRRFEDPEYQDRLAQGRDRGEAGARYGY